MMIVIRSVILIMSKRMVMMTMIVGMMELMATTMVMMSAV